MKTLTNKIDFAVVMMVNNANPNGDPLNGNRPRETNDGYGEISDVCIKRKIRNRLQDMGENIFVQSQERVQDGYKSLFDRAKGNKRLSQALDKNDSESVRKIACKEWLDVRAFGQVFASKGSQKAVSVGIHGPVSIQSAFSIVPVSIESMQITKSVNGTTSEKKGRDTMGMKHKVSSAMYVAKGSINCQLAQKTGFSDEDAEKIKEALKTLFENDASAARPEGSMEVCKVYWWKHNRPTGQYSSAKVHRSLVIEANTDDPKSFNDYTIKIEPLEGLQPEEIEGM